MRFGLTSNPFEWAGSNHKMADRKDEMKRIRAVLTSCFEGPVCRFVFLQGDYGMGKTFMLDVIYKEATNTRGVLPIRNVITEQPILMRTFLRSTPEIDLVSNIIKNMGRDRIIECWKKASDRKPFETLSSVIERLEEGDESAWTYLIGGRLNKAESEAIGVKRGKQSPEDMLDVFYNLLRLVRAADYQTLLILVDEFEAIMSSVGKTKAVAVFDTFRAIFDEAGRHIDDMAKVVFVFGISGQALDKITDLEKDLMAKTGGGGIAPFRERILHSDSIELKPFGPEETLELVETRLKEVRSETAVTPIYPFSREAVEYIDSVSDHKPRFVLQNCYIVLEEASKKKEVNEISAEFAQGVLSRLGLVSRTEDEATET